MVFRMFLSFSIFDPTENFANALALVWAIAFARWPILKIVSVFDYLVFFLAIFYTKQL